MNDVGSGEAAAGRAATSAVSRSRPLGSSTASRSSGWRFLREQRDPARAARPGRRRDARLDPNFLTPGNLANVARQAAIVGILGVGMTFVILTAGIDLSVGSIVGFAAITFATLMAQRRALAAGDAAGAWRPAAWSARSTAWASRRAACSRSS